MISILTLSYCGPASAHHRHTTRCGVSYVARKSHKIPLKRHVGSAQPTPAERKVNKAEDADSVNKAPDEITLNAGAGKPVGELLSEIGAEVESQNQAQLRLVVSGNFSGPREIVAQKVLEDFNYAIFHDHSHLKVIVIQPSARSGAKLSAGPSGGPKPEEARR